MSPGKPRIIHLIVLVSTILVATRAIAATPAREASATKKRVAVFPLVAAADVDAQLAEALESRILEASEIFSELELISGNALRKRLRKKPSMVMAQCERSRRFAACMAAYTRKARSQEAVLARVKPGAEGLELLVLVVTAAGEVERRAKQSFVTVGDVYTKLDARGLAAVYSLQPAMARSAAVAAPPPDSESLFAPPLVSDPQPASPSPDARVVASVPQVSEPTAYPAPPEIYRVAATSPLPESLDALPSELEAERTSYLRLSGVGLLGAGALAAGAGAIFGLQARQIRSDIKRNGTLVQRQAATKYRNANDLTSRANLFFAIGASVVVLGGVLLGLDLAIGAD